MWFPYPPQLRVGVYPPLEEEIVTMIVVLVIGGGDVPRIWTGAYGFGTASTIAVILRMFAQVAAIDQRSGVDTGDGALQL